MSSIVVAALKMTLGLLWNKARSSLGDYLKDGDLNWQTLQKLIVSDLEDIKTKLDGLARRDLLSSASFIKEGLRLLGVLIDKSSNSALPKVKREGNSSMATNVGVTSSNVDSALKLVEAMSKLKISSSGHFASAIKSFENANTKATEAFHNEALSIEDRILATKLRAQSRLLLSLENPDLATACKLYLEELHGLRVVVEGFSLALQGGMLSRFNKGKRLNLVLSVSMINFVVFQFLKSFTKGPVNVYNWPVIKLVNGTYDPLIPSEKILDELEKIEVAIPNFVFLQSIGWEIRDFMPNLISVTSKGELILQGCSSSGGENLLKLALNNASVFSTVLGCRFSCLAIDSEDNVHCLEKPVFSSLTLQDPTCRILTFDSQGNLIPIEVNVRGSRYSHTLSPTPKSYGLVVRRDKGAYSTLDFYKNVDLSDSSSPLCQPSSSLKVKLWDSSVLSVSDKYVVAAEESGHQVRVFEKDGQLVREFELHGGEREACMGITFNNLTKELVVVSRVGTRYNLSTYVLDTGERRHNVRLSHIGKGYKELGLTSHCSGSVVVITAEHILYVQ